MNSKILELYSQYADMVYRIAFLLLKNPSDAEDVLQSVFVKLIRHNKRFENDEHIKAWLILTAKNSAKDILKSAWRKRNVPVESAKEIACPINCNVDIYEAVMSLDPKYRIPLYLYYFEGYSTAEVSAILKINHSTVRSQIRIAREKLKLALEV